MGWVRSSVTVGHVALWEKVATAVLGEIVDGDEEKRGELGLSQKGTCSVQLMLSLPRVLLLVGVDGCGSLHRL